MNQTLTVSESDFFEPIDALHRGDNSIIGFLRKNGESKTGVENLFAATKEQVRAMLPDLAKWLLQDAYFSVNGYNSTAPYKVRSTGLPGVWRKEKNLRYLNAVYADLDIGRTGERGARGLSVNDANQVLIDLIFERPGSNIPTVSLTAQSGRGLYAFWILRDDDDENAPVTFKGQRNFVETLALYKKVNRAIYKRLECLAADRICDAARILRVPGTRHSGTGEICKYYLGRTLDLNGESKLITYTLSELAAAFGVPVLEKSLPAALREWTPNGTVNAKKANGPRELAKARARDLVTLEQWRGGWTKGNRRFCLRLYAQFLRAAGSSYVDAARAVEIMARNCKPAYPSDTSDEPLKALLNDVWREPFAKSQYTQLNLVKWLQITADESRELELEKIIPIEIQDERAATAKATGRAASTTTRRAAINLLIETRGLLSEREFANALQAQGIDASAASVHRDLIALGLQDSTARKKAGRPKNEQMQLIE